MTHYGKTKETCPPEPPVGTWMRDRFGGTTQRQKDGWGEPGTMPYGKWQAMWEARGPYVECGPWGAELEPKPDPKERLEALVEEWATPRGPGRFTYQQGRTDARNRCADELRELIKEIF